MPQTGKNIAVQYKVESSFNTAPGTPSSGAKEFLIGESPGAVMNRDEIRSRIIRSDGQRKVGRLGFRDVSARYNTDLIVGAQDDWLEALMRGTWVAQVDITETEMTSITTTTSEIVAAAGSWITEGVRVGDIVRLSNHQTAANNDRNLRVTAVTASTITVAETLTTDASADTAFTLSILKKLSNPASPTDRSFYIEEYLEFADESLVIGGARVDSLSLSGSPNGNAEAEFGIIGASLSRLETASAPFYSNVTTPTGESLIFLDALIRLGGTDITATSFSLDIGLGGSSLPVIGSTTTPNVYPDEMTVSSQFSAVRDDLQRFADYDAEKPFELHLLLAENEAEPKDVISFFMGNLRLRDADAPLGQSGAMIETVPFAAGVKEGVTGYDTATVTVCTSAA